MCKKFLTAAAALGLLASLTACGGEPAPTEAAPVSPTVSAADTTSPADAFEEIVLADNDSCTVKITAIDADNTWGYTLKAFLENKTDLELMFTLDDVSVNGFMCDPFWAVSVPAGIKANEEISFSDSDFDRNGIREVTDISFTLKVYDNGDWTAEHLVNEVHTIYPMGADAVEAYAYTPVDGEIVLFDNADAAMIITGFDPDGQLGYTARVYLENRSDKSLMFSLDGASVNGFLCDPFWAASVAPGKRSNTEISWSDSDFEANGIETVESLVLPVRVYDENDWMADDLIDENFTVNP